MEVIDTERVPIKFWLNLNQLEDEAPGSYKDIDEVMENQKDLVKIVTKLKPLGSIKG